MLVPGVPAEVGGAFPELVPWGCCIGIVLPVWPPIVPPPVVAPVVVPAAPDVPAEVGGAFPELVPCWARTGVARSAAVAARTKIFMVVCSWADTRSIPLHARQHGASV